MDRNYKFGRLLCFRYFKPLRLGYEKNQETQELYKREIVLQLKYIAVNLKNAFFIISLLIINKIVYE